MKLERGTFFYQETQSSAAQMVAEALTRSRVAAALHTLPVSFLKRSEKLDVDVLVAADDRKTFEEAAEIVRSIGKLRPLYGGPLSMASSIERITPLLLNLAKLNGFKTPSIKFVE
jgi:predicted dinucleotide-binding enzyme